MPWRSRLRLSSTNRRHQQLSAPNRHRSQSSKRRSSENGAVHSDQWCLSPIPRTVCSQAGLDGSRSILRCRGLIWSRWCAHRLRNRHRRVHNAAWFRRPVRRRPPGSPARGRARRPASVRACTACHAFPSAPNDIGTIIEGCFNGRFQTEKRKRRRSFVCAFCTQSPKLSAFAGVGW